MSGPEVASSRLAGIGSRSRTDLVATHRDGLGDLVFDDVLHQAHPTGFALGGASAQFSSETVIAASAFGPLVSSPARSAHPNGAGKLLKSCGRSARGFTSSS
jgi:hypothetical protein